MSLPCFNSSHFVPNAPLAASPLWSHPVLSPLSGEVAVPGDKSISHRALMIGALAVGETFVAGLLEGEDVLRTAAAMRSLGAEIERLEAGSWRIRGRGVGGLSEPSDVLDMGNAGTGARLLMGVLATHPFVAVLTGDASLRRRPMARVAAPLAEMGARFLGRSGDRLPLAVQGASIPVPIVYQLPVPSAQVKSAALLAGLNAPGQTVVIEPEATRDHTERMLQAFGASILAEPLPSGGRRIVLEGRPELLGRHVVVPGDPSSAAFPAAAALLVPGSETTIRNVGLNPLRTGLFETLREMGARIEILNLRREAGEEIGDLVVRHSCLKAVRVPAERAPRMIDEYPILSVLAACAEGETRMEGLAELRVKESDRLEATARGLALNGVEALVDGDALVVRGNGRAPKGGGMVSVNLDHRIAMSFLILGMAADAAVGIDDARAIDTSFPGFAALVNGLGGRILPSPNASSTPRI